MNAIAQEATWQFVEDIHQPPEADAVDAAAEAEEVTAVAGEEVTAPESPPHAPTFNYANFPANHRVGAVPENLLPFLIEATAEGWTPPFYVSRTGKTRAAVNPIPGCPPIEPGGKALVFDDWGKPRVIEVTGMHEGEIRGMLGSIPLQCQAWVAMSAEAPLTATDVAVRPDRLTEEEATALEAELFEWSKFLGHYAEKYGWCSTFESILRDVGVQPWRPGFESVTLEMSVNLDKEKASELVNESMGGEATLNSVMATTRVTLKDVSRQDYDAGRWDPLLKAAGYKNYVHGSVYVISKKAVSL
jgi:hypothetical protein